jgi:hypothetical protein
MREPYRIRYTSKVIDITGVDAANREDRRRTSPATRAMMDAYIEREYPEPGSHAIELQAELEDQARFVEAYPFATILPAWQCQYPPGLNTSTVIYAIVVILAALALCF